MAKSLLLGNGINARIGIKGLSVPEIKERFRHNIFRNSFVLEAFYGITLSKEVCDDIIQSSKADGNESLAGSLYIYIKTHTTTKWTDNDEIRLQDVVKEDCIYLHGKIDLDTLGDGKNILLASKERNCFFRI